MQVGKYKRPGDYTIGCPPGLYYVILCILTLYSGYTRESLALDGLKESTATGRNIRYRVSKAKLVDTSHRVATAYE